MSNTDPLVLLDFETTEAAPVATITLNDPDRRNALSLTMSEALADTVAVAEAEGAGALIITGANPAFCAGADLDALASADRDGLEGIYLGFLAVFQSSIPSIAAVNGAAVGAGLNLALCCDVRLAGESALFNAGFTRLNVHPGGGATWMLDRIVGRQGALALGLFGDSLGGLEAAATGLAWRCLPDDDLLDAARTLARNVAGIPSGVRERIYANTERTSRTIDHDSAMRLELVDQIWSLQQPEAQAAIARMQERISS